MIDRVNQIGLFIVTAVPTDGAGTFIAGLMQGYDNGQGQRTRQGNTKDEFGCRLGLVRRSGLN